MRVCPCSFHFAFLNTLDATLAATKSKFLANFDSLHNLQERLGGQDQRSECDVTRNCIHQHHVGFTYSSGSSNVVLILKFVFLVASFHDVEIIAAAHTRCFNCIITAGWILSK